MSSVKPKKGRDFYAILGVERTANQGQIKQAYRKLAMQYHPDKNPGNAENAEKFKEVSVAYSVLSDPNKKRQYDIHGEDGSTIELNTINVENLGAVARLFGALISKAGVPVPTEITTKVLSNAQLIAQGRENGPGVPSVTDLIWGETITSCVERQNAHFYRITVSEQDLNNGIIISCTSNDNDKFKVVFFDNNGQVTMIEESQKRKKHSEANLFIVPYARYNLVETMPLAMMRRLDDDVPPIFMILDTFDMDVKSLLPGTHLFCVYGDNWLQSIKYSLRCIQAVAPNSKCVMDIRTAEEQLAEKKRQLTNFQSEFCDLKKKYEAACKKLEADVTEIVSLVQQRETSYNDFIAQSSQKYALLPGTANGTISNTGLLGGIGKLFG